VALSSKQKSSPARVSVYLVTDKEYANPELRGKYETGDFTNFIVSDDSLLAKDGDPIEVSINSDEILENTKFGIYTYSEEKDDSETSVEPSAPSKLDSEKPKKEEGTETNRKEDEDYIKVDQDDVSIKNKKRSTIIRDKDVEGGVNLLDKLISPDDKRILKIDNWDSITTAKEFFNNKGEVIAVKIWNKNAEFGDRKRKYKIVDGQPFEIAKKFVEEAKNRVKY